MPLPDDYEERVRAERREKDEFLAGHPRSPIPEDERGDFDGLDYYAVDPDYRFELPLHEHDEKESITISTTQEGEREYLRWGAFRFELHGEEQTLQAYRRPAAKDVDEGFWLPFRDETNGDETYGGGRYLDLEAGEDQTASGEWVVDFNRAYNPFCVYNEDYECPLVPQENWLDVPIRAGEKLFE